MMQAFLGDSFAVVLLADHSCVPRAALKRSSLCRRIDYILLLLPFAALGRAAWRLLHFQRLAVLSSAGDIT